jgi:hypothetical protein
VIQLYVGQAGVQVGRQAIFSAFFFSFFSIMKKKYIEFEQWKEIFKYFFYRLSMVVVFEDRECLLGIILLRAQH